MNNIDIYLQKIMSWSFPPTSTDKSTTALSSIELVKISELALKFHLKIY